MQTLKMDEKTARRLYPTAAPEFKTLLEENFGKTFFSMEITDRVQSLDDIFEISGKTMADIEKPGDTIDEVNYKLAKLIASVYNDASELKALDAFDTNQYKYFPWHKVSGSGLSFDDFGLWYSHSGVGVRLCFKEAKDAIDAGKKFIDVYTKLKTQ